MKRKLCFLIFGLFAVLSFFVSGRNTGALAREIIDVPSFSARMTSGKNGIKLSVNKTAGADGYCIYLQAPGAKRYKLIRTIRRDGTVRRTYTKKNLTEGTYSVKICAYHVNEDGTKNWSDFSPVKKVQVTLERSLSERIMNTPEIIEFVNPMTGFDPSADGQNSKNGKKMSSPVYYDLRAKKDVKLTQKVVFRLYAIKNDESGYDENTSVAVDEKALSISVKKTFTGDICLMGFAYISEDDADARINPVACTEHLMVHIGKIDNPGNGNGQPRDGEPGDGNAEDEKYADITFKNGYAYFGSYPQTKVTDASVISELNKLKDKVNSQVITYDGKKYIYEESAKNWVKEAPVEWIILKGSADSDSVTLMSNKILLESGYSSWKGFEAGGSWKDSFVRNHLNGYNSRFESIWSFDFFGVLFEGSIQRVLMEQTYGDCSDKVLLPTKKQLSKMTAQERIRKASTLAYRADQKGYWCIDSDGKGNITAVNPKGEFTAYKAYCQDGQGFVPVIKVDLKKCNIKKK